MLRSILRPSSALAAFVLAAAVGCGGGDKGAEPKAPANAGKVEPKAAGGPGAPKPKAE